MYNFNHLYYFYITARSGGVNAAAKHLSISQPSLSSQLKVLEGSLDLRLFQKVGRNNQLTQAGSVVYGFCKQMFEISEEMEELVAKKVPSASRRIHIGVSNEVDRAFVSEIVSLFLKNHGLAMRPKVSVISASHDQLVEQLRHREIDALVTEVAIIDPELKSLERAEGPVALACSIDWKLKSKTKSQNVLAALKNIEGGESAQWLMPSSRFKLRSEIDQFFEENHLKGRIVFESDVMASVVRSVVDGIGMAFLPMLYVAREVREKSLQVMGPKEGFWRYRVWLACHNQNRNDPLIKSLSLAFKDIASDALISGI